MYNLQHYKSNVHLCLQTQVREESSTSKSSDLRQMAVLLVSVTLRRCSQLKMSLMTKSRSNTGTLVCNFPVLKISQSS